MKFHITLLLVVILSLSTSIATSAEQTRKGPASFAYVLQAEKLASSRNKVVTALAKCDRDWIVLDISYQDHQLWTKPEITAIRQGKKNRKVIAYLSIGEAEEYRGYWKKEWHKKHPPFILKENKDWKGNFLVKFWDKEWQQIIAKQINTAMQLGFDGLYLDKVDSFEDYEYDPQKKDWIDHRRNKETKSSYREDMILFGKKVAKIARNHSAQAIIIPQNGEQLLEDKTWLNTISGIGIEDLFSDGEKLQSKQYINDRQKNIIKCAEQGKTVLLIDYSTHEKIRRTVRKKSKQPHYLLLITDRDLTTLGK